MPSPRERTIYDWVLEIVSLVALLWSCYPLLFYNRLGADFMIPIHYNGKGEIDGWGGRHYLWILPLITLALYLCFTLMERYYKKFNYPYKVTEENADFLYRESVRLIRHIKAFSLLLFAYLNNTSYTIATGNDSGLDGFVMFFLIGGAFLSVVLFFIKAHIFKKYS